MSADKEAVLDFLRSSVSATIPKTLNAQYGGIAVYMRAGAYHYDPDEGTRLPAIGVVNVQIDEDNEEGTGCFRDFITELEARGAEYGYRFIRMEQVQSQHLQLMLERHAYIKTIAFDDVLVKEL